MGEKKKDIDDQQFSSVEKMAAPPKLDRNMYALGCTMLASLASILLGYGTSVHAVDGWFLFCRRVLILGGCL